MKGAAINASEIIINVVLLIIVLVFLVCFYISLIYYWLRIATTNFIKYQLFFIIFYCLYIYTKKVAVFCGLPLLLFYATVKRCIFIFIYRFLRSCLPMVNQLLDNAQKNVMKTMIYVLKQKKGATLTTTREKNCTTLTTTRDYYPYPYYYTNAKSGYPYYYIRF